MTDVRYQFITNKLTQTYPSASPQGLQQAMQMPENAKICDAFLNGDEQIPALIFSYIKETQAWNVSTPQTVTANKGRGVYFIRRTATAVPNKEQQVLDALLSGSFDNNFLGVWQQMLKQVYMPIFSTQTDWGKSTPEQSKEFLSSLSKFSENLEEAVSSQVPSIVLAKPEPKFVIANTPKDTTAAKTNTELLSVYESMFLCLVNILAIVNEWIEQIKSVLQEENSSGENKGPKDEIQFWKSRFAKLNSIVEQLRKEENKAILSVLQAARSGVQKDWKDKDIELTDAMNEAKDNVKYLTSIEKYVEQLYTGTPHQIIDILSGLLKNIRLMYSIARYYSTEDRMVMLFKRLTNKMIENCQYTLTAAGRLWDQNAEQLVVILKSCIKLKDEYIRHYRLERDKLALQPSGRQFNFNELQLFGKFELFCSRIESLVELFSTIEQFNALQAHNIDGMESLISKFFTYVEEIKRKNTDQSILDYTKNSFDKDYIAFNKKIANLEQSLQVFINTSFENISSSEVALNMLKKFQSILQRESLRAELENKYTVIFHNYGLQLENIQKIYEKYNKKARLVRNAPPVAGNIIWSRQLARRIEDPMKKFQQIPAIMKSKESKKIIKTYNKVMKALFKFEAMWVEAWHKRIMAAKAGLEATLFVKIAAKFYVNFDREILQLIRETKWLMKLGSDIPENARIVLLQENKFKLFYGQLTHVIHEYERILGLIKPEVRPLLAQHIEDMEKKIEPGVTMLTWTSTNVEVYIKRLIRAVGKFEELVNKMNDIIENRIVKSLQSIGDSYLVNLPVGETLMLDHFVDLQEKHIKTVTNSMNITNKEVEKAVEDVLYAITTFALDKPVLLSAFELDSFKQNFESQMMQAITKCTVNSLDLLKKRVSPTKAKPFQAQIPLFSLSLNLGSPEITLTPGLHEIQEAVTRASLAVLSCSKKLTGWTYREKQAKVSFFQDIGKEKSVIRVVILLLGVVNGLRRQVFGYLENFKRYEFLSVEDKQRAYEKFIQKCANNPTLEHFEAELKKYLDIEDEVNLISEKYSLGSVVLAATNFKAALKEKANQWKAQYAKNLHQNAKEQQDALLTYIEESNKKAATDINTLENLRFVMNVLKEVRERESSIDFEFRILAERYNTLRRYNVTVPKEEFDEVFDLPVKWAKLTNLANKVTEKISSLQGGFRKRLIKAITEFKVDVVQFRNEFDAHGPMIAEITPQEAMERLKKFQRLYYERETKFDTYKAGEELFGLTVSEYPVLTQTKKELTYLDKLYTLYSVVLKKVKGYEDILWDELDFQSITAEVNQFSNECNHLPKDLKKWDAYKKLRQTIDEFLELQPLIERLKEPSLVERHWNQIQNVVKKKFKQEESFKLKNILEADLLKYKEDVEEICLASRKEADIEQKIKNVEKDWKDRELVFAEYSHRGMILLKGQETAELMEALEDSQMTVGSLMSSRYLEPFREKVSGWMITLFQVTETLQQWLAVQSLWMYLEAVFNSGDISRDLPQEAKKFNGIDKTWVKIMQKAVSAPNVIKFCYENEMLKSLPSLKIQLEECQKSLAGYLGQKRDIFPRFYFCSDPVLLEILSQSSDPTSIQPHLPAIFDSINTVDFDDRQTNKMIRMNSAEKESVDFSTPVIATGNVEDWLQKLEVEMTRTMRDKIRKAHEESSNFTSLREFININCAQAALIGIQFIWTADSENALRKGKSGDKKAMGENLKKVEQMLSDLTTFTTENLSPCDRTKIETLITIQVHQRDVFYDLFKNRNNLVKDGPTDFEWQRQARFYWQQDQDTAVIWVADIDQEYCYEYLGCKERLVITALTDRCYITLCQALGMKLGGAPAGPAGTGKTETTKDLGRSLGKYVVVFNCSDQLDFRAMAKIFKGLSQSGSWGCLDEFNRIELEVLSVVAQQIQCIFSALREGVTKFTFTDGQVCKLSHRTGMFITFNPGYAGRVELPENLKVQFRGVAMMVPDRQMIIRVKLAAAGYKQNDILSKKFNVLYRLCEQQLSKQPHYDFGLRNILSVLRTAGETKRSNTDKSENILLMRTLRDMNTSKLVFEDVSLFLSLINDLFPNLKAEKRLFPQLEAGLKKVAAQMRLVHHPDWIDKVIQLYETSLVRHGIMVVGPAGVGKTKAYAILLQTMTEIDKPHKEARMNPKAITANQMFGRLDPIQNEWTDGIFSALWKVANKQKKQNIWIICDGPVDAVWIENLNTVLDDNKLLTLANGDRIAMAPTVKMCFEVENLNNASPATVSRAGQIYMSDTVLGWKPVLESKFSGTERKGELIKPFSDKETPLIKDLFSKYIDNALRFAEKNVRQVMSVASMNQVVTCFDILCGVVREAKQGAQAADLSPDHLEKLFIFCLCWSVGALLEQDDRIKFSDYVCSQTKVVPKLTNGLSIYDFFVSSTTKNWTNWQELVKPYAYPANDMLDFSTLYVATPDSVRMEYLVDKIAEQNKDVLLLGGSGTAKTVTAEHYIKTLDQEKMSYKKINFSSATTPNIFQNTIASVIEKRFRAFGPPGNKKMIVFIDDVNMPEINEWGDQVTNENVRQLMDMKGFYNLEKPGEWIAIEDLQYIGAMSHPGGGKNDIPNRLKRQFAIFNVTLPSKTSIDQIYGSIIRGRYNDKRGFSSNIIAVADAVTDATVILWKRVAEKMLPTPSKFHYIFNLRDLSRVYQGIMLCPGNVITSPEILLSLWKHECNRVFSDRLNDVDDKIWFDQAITALTKQQFGEDLAEKTKVTSYFVNFLRDPKIDEETGEEVEAAPKIYEPISSLPNLRARLEMFMQKYNQKNNKGRTLDLVLFDNAIKHCVRIARILAMPRGSALLVGVGGSGKQSLTKLASFIARFETKQIVLYKSYGIAQLFENIRELYKLTGLQGQSITFIFTDNEIKMEVFLEYINNILSSGEVAGLFTKDDLDAIINDLRPIAKRDYWEAIGKNDSYDNLYRLFINRVRDNLHIVLCFSPVGEKFRTRALKFPGLISGTTINWFFPWPEDALVNVAKKFLDSYQMECDVETKESLVHHMANVHLAMNNVADQYFERYRRHVYTTPKSFLSFILLYKEVYKKKHAEVNELAEKVNQGLDKLNKAADDVKQLQVTLKEKELKLAVAQKEIDELLKDIAVSTAKAAKKKEEVEGVKNALQKDFDIVQGMKEDAEKDLAIAKPALEEAVNAVSSIKPADITFLKGLKAPPPLVKIVFDGVLVLRYQPMDKVVMAEDKKGRKVLGDSYSNSLKMMADTKFLQYLLNFDKDAINEETIELLEPYLQIPDFNKKALEQVSKPAAALVTWVCAMHTYFFVARDVRPKTEKLLVLEGKLKAAQASLRKKEEELAKVQGELDEIQLKFDEANKRKQDLKDDADKTKRFMEQANNLIGALAGERSRWTDQSNEFKDMIKRLTGDVALACAFISYCGPFNSEFRKLLLREHFYKDCSSQGIPVTKDLNVTKFLTDEAQIGEWNLQGLPSDDHSLQNAIMVTRSSKWPLLVDPQGQGLAWLKKREAENQLRVVRITDKNFKTNLEDCMSLGLPMIIENIDEEVDPMLDPVLEKAIVMSGKTKQIIVSDKACDFDDNFRLFLTTKLPNPHFTPEMYAKTTVIDFTVTMGGLEQQLLGYVIQKEKAELEERREKLLQEVNQNQKHIKNLEDELLNKLKSSDKNLIEDEDLVRVLARTKKAASEVQEKLNIAKETEKRINDAREEYRPVAIRGSVLYFLVVELSLVNPMYQTSLKQFLYLFDKGISNSEKAQAPAKRIENIIDYSTYSIYQYISRGLFKKHKFLFVLLLACKILLRDDKITYEAFGALLKGGAALDSKSVGKNPFEKWLPDTAYLNIINLSRTLEIFKSLPELMSRNEKAWEKLYDDEKPEVARIPDIHDKLSKFQILLLIRSLREDRTILAAQEFIRDLKALGPKYVDAMAVNLEEVWEESSRIIPLICLLSPGSDPTSMIETLAKKKKKELHLISMGQGQEVRAKELMKSGFATGQWVLLQNCHLGLNYINSLEDTIREEQNNMHTDFRLWITSEPNEKFSIGLLQMSIKLTLEGDVGIKAGMKTAMQFVTQDMLDASRRPEWRPLLYTVCMLSSVVGERRKFNALGWNIPYEFNFADLNASLQFLQNHFAAIGDDAKKGPQISWPTVKYMICEVHYGGKITDDNDRTLFRTYGDRYLNKTVTVPNYVFKENYTIPIGEDRMKYVEHVEKLPTVDHPEVFGLHQNADISYRTQQSQDILSTILDIQPKESSGSGGETREQKVMKIAIDLESKMPSNFKPDDIQENYKRLGGNKESLTVFLVQEIDRLQRLITLTRKTLKELKLAIDGTIIMSQELSDALNFLHDSRVPPKWVKLSWESSSLGNWFDELQKRHEQLYSWLTKDRPKSFWLTGFYNPQGFLTAVRQEVTRGHGDWALDDVVVKTEVSKLNIEKDDIPSLNEGVYIHGLFLEGSGWDWKNARLEESQPKALYVPLPVMLVTAVKSSDKKETKKPYSCPVYRNKTRRELNFIFHVDLNCAEDESHWRLRSVALLCNKQ